MPTIYDRLKTLQITLPDTPPSVVDGYVASFVPFVRTGDLIHFSGRVAKKDGKLWVGKLGEEITVSEGYGCASHGPDQLPRKEHDGNAFSSAIERRGD